MFFLDGSHTDPSTLFRNYCSVKFIKNSPVESSSKTTNCLQELSTSIDRTVAKKTHVAIKTNHDLILCNLAMLLKLNELTGKRGFFLNIYRLLRITSEKHLYCWSHLFFSNITYLLRWLENYLISSSETSFAKQSIFKFYTEFHWWNSSFKTSYQLSTLNKLLVNKYLCLLLNRLLISRYT